MTETNLENLKLSYGGHKSRDEGMCLLEAVAYVAGEPHTDHPACTDPVLGAFGRAVNDFMTDDERLLLVPIVPKLVGTAGDHTLSLRRALLICDGTVRQILPLAMEAAGLAAEAETLRKLAPVVDAASASAAYSAAYSAAESAADAAWSAADAAWSAASAAASAESAANAAYSAAASAAKSAAWSAAHSAAYSAAESAARKPVVEAIIQIFNAAIEVQS